MTLIFTNDVMGEIEPCGCRRDPAGGLVRKLNLLQELKKTENHFLQVDAGNLFFSTTDVPEPLAAQAKAQAGFLVRGLNQLGHNAFVPGPKDFSFGLEYLLVLRGHAKFDFLAANLLVRASDLPLFDPYKIYPFPSSDGKSNKIAVLGLVGAGQAWPRSLKITSASAAAKKWIPELQKKADLIVVVTHQGLPEDRKLASAVQGIDIIVGGATQDYLQTPEVIGKTIVSQGSYRNMDMGVMPLERPLDPAKYQMVNLGVEYEEENKISPLIVEFKTKIAELNTLEDQRISQASTSGITHSTYQTFPRCAECHMEQFDFWRKSRHGNALESLLLKKQIRNKECLSCHTLALDLPGGFQHVTKMAELSSGAPKNTGAQKTDPEPKTLTPEDLSRFLSALHGAANLDQKITVPKKQKKYTVRHSVSHFNKAWGPVQCENCHRAGGEHPFSDGYSKVVKQETCLKCHTPSRAPSWYDQDGKLKEQLIKKKVMQIQCPVG